MVHSTTSLRASASRVATAGIVLVLFVSVTSTGVVSIAGSAADGTTARQSAASIGGDGTPLLAGDGTTERRSNSTANRRTITLVTGDRVAVDVTDEEVTVADANGLRVVEAPGGTYVYPGDIDLSRFDRGLFNVDLLVEEGFTDGQTDSIPVIVDETAKEYGAVGTTDVSAMNAVTGLSKADAMSGLGAASVEVDKAHASKALSAIRRNYDVDKVYLDRTVEVTLDESAPAIGADRVQQDLGIDGSGVTVAVLDTGVNGSHPAITEVDEKRFIDTDTDDVAGHGTHVAGIVAGDDDTYTGVAPGAGIMDVKVLNDNGGGSLSDVASGIDYAVTNGADVISMSLGAPDYGSDPFLATPIENAIENDVTVVAAAGNAGSNGLYTITRPGSLEGPITVGATDADFDQISGYSSRGPTVGDTLLKPDVVAPGTDITSADNDGGYVQYDGTSMAAPHVSGVAALLLANDSSLGHDEVKDIIVSQTDPINSGWDPLERGTGQVNAMRALTGDIVVDKPVRSRGLIDTRSDRNVTYRLRNRGEESQPIELDATLARIDYGTSFDETVTLNRSSVTIPSGGTTAVNLTLSGDVPHSAYSGTLNVTDGTGDLLARGAHGFVRNKTKVSGTVETGSGTPVTDDRVRANNGKLNGEWITDSNGQFDFHYPTNSQVPLWYHETTVESGTHVLAPDRDGLPDVYVFGEYSVGDTTKSLDLTLPEGHLLNVSVVDSNGNPVDDARVHVAHSKNGGSQVAGAGTQTTTAEGLYKHKNAQTTGIELTGTVQVEVKPPKNDQRFGPQTITDEFTLSSTTTKTYTLDSNTVEVTGRVEESTGDPAKNDTVVMSHNGTTTPAVNLTNSTGGFSLAVERGEPGTRLGGAYEFQYYQGNLSDGTNRFARDDSVDLYVPREVNASETVDVGTINLPEGHVVNTTVVGPGGSAVENATISYAHTSNDSEARGGFRFANGTDATGLFRQADGTAGLEVADNVTVTAVAEPTLRADLFDNGTAQVQRNVSADSDLSLTLPGVRLNTTPEDPVVGQSVTVNASESVGTITSYQWAFGDGSTNTTTDSNDTHTYDSAGTYTVTLTATNNESETATTTSTVAVRAQPTIDITSIAEDEALNSSSVDLDASATNTVAKDTLEYKLDEGAWQTLTDSTTLSALSDGTHDVSVRVRADDNTVHATDTVTFTVDTVAPGFSGISVADTYQSGGTEYANETVSTSFSINNDDQKSLAAVRVALESQVTNYRHRIAAEHDSGTYSGTIDLDNVTDDGAYNLTITAVDEAGNSNQTVVTGLEVDRRAPQLSAAIEQTAADTATITVRSSEAIRSSVPSVNVTTPQSDTKEVAVTATSNTREYNATIDISSSGTYVVSANGTDLAGNYGLDTASASVNTSLSTDGDNTAAVVNVDTGSFVEFTTDQAVSDTFVSLSETDTVYEETTESQVGLGSLTGRLGDALAGNLTNATIAISIANTTIPSGVDRKDVSLRRYNTTTDSWNSKETTVKQLDRPDLGVSGAYWVANVTQFSTYGAIATDQSGPTLTSVAPASDGQLTGGTTRTDVSFAYSDTGTGINVSAVELRIDGTDVTDAARTNITSTKTTYSGYPVAADQRYTATLNVTDQASNEQQFSTSFSVPPDPSAAFSAGNNPTAGSATSFDASSSGGALASYQWVFGDGTTTTTSGATTEHTYSTAGTYKVTLTVTDDGGQTATVTRSIDVSTASSSGPLGGPPLPSAGDSSSETSSSDTASFELRLDVENRVAGGTALPISLDVENVGSSTTIETVTITVDGQTIATERVRLSAGGSTTLTATASVPVDAAGQSLAIEATAGTASDSATVRVRGGVAGSSSGPVAIETVEFPAEAEAGAAVSADVTVSNTGDQRVSETIRYRVAGETIADQTLSLEPGESTTVTLAGSVPNDLDGTVTQTVRIGAEEQSESLRLSESGHSSSIPGFGVLVAMFALILAAGVRVFELRRQ